jgi:hypothetical protein
MMRREQNYISNNLERLERILTMMYVVQNSQNFSGLFHLPVFQKTRRFGNWICFCPQVKVGEKTPTQLGPLERVNLNHWTNTGRWKKSRKIV